MLWLIDWILFICRRSVCRRTYTHMRSFIINYEPRHSVINNFSEKKIVMRCSFVGKSLIIFAHCSPCVTTRLDFAAAVMKLNLLIYFFFRWRICAGTWMGGKQNHEELYFATHNLLFFSVRFSHNFQALSIALPFVNRILRFKVFLFLHSFIASFTFLVRQACIAQLLKLMAIVIPYKFLLFCYWELNKIKRQYSRIIRHRTRAYGSGKLLSKLWCLK